MIAVLVTTAFAWSATIALRQPVWSPIDEGEHWSIADSLARHGTLPDPRRPPLIPAALPRWNDPATAFEGYNPPVAYLALAGVERITAAVWPHLPLSEKLRERVPVELAEVRAERLLNAAAFAMLILTLWLAGRTIAPGNAVLPVAMASIPFMFRDLVLEATRVGNDLVAGLLGTVAVYLALRWRRRIDWRTAFGLGLLVGVAALSKYNALYAALPVVLVLGTGLHEGSELSPRSPRVFRSLVGLGSGLAIVVLPWLALAEHLHGCVGCASQQLAYLPAPFHTPAMTVSVAVDQMGENVHNLFDGVGGGAAFRNGRGLPEAVLPPFALALGVAGTVGTVTRAPRWGLARSAGLALSLCAVAVPVFLLMMSVASGVDIARGGRLDAPGLLPIAFLLAAGPGYLATGRGGRVVAGCCVAVAIALAGREIAFALNHSLTSPWL